MGAGHAHALYVHEHSAVHHLAPQVKVASAFAFVFLVALTPRHAVPAFLADLVALLVVIRLARVPLPFVLRRLLIVAPFVAFAFLVPFVATGERVEVLGVAVSRDGLWGTWNVLAKATLGGLVSVTLAATTEVSDLLRGLDRLRVPHAFTAIAGTMVRYLEVLAGEVRRLRTAMLARAYAPRWIGDARPVAAASGSLFIRSFERGERVHAAMLARGYTGVMPDTGRGRHEVVRWSAAVPLPAVAAVGLVLAMVLT